ncbi:MAG: hypothetical protein K0S63_598 [Gammaproteobacteria bacterium]|jgi:hypothetical protein|nr:hypothetical protein [Gammaproteobacteria bacterium]
MITRNKTRDYLNDWGNALFGFCGGLFADTTAIVGATALPVFALLVGVCDIQEALANKENLSGFSRMCRLNTGIFSIVEGIENFGHFALGAPGCGLLPVALAVRAGVDLLCAIEKCMYNSTTSTSGLDNYPNKAADVGDVIKKGIALTGWCLLACGNPLGWAFLLASATLSFLSRAKCLGGQGLFARSQRSISGGEWLDDKVCYDVPPVVSAAGWN